MHDLAFQQLTDSEAAAFLEEIAPTIAPVAIAPQNVRVAVATPSFYGDFKVYSVADLSLPAPNERFILHRPGDAVLMNWTNEPIYGVNERAQLQLNKSTLASYSKFFFHFVRGALGRFIIVENPAEVPWGPDATEKERADVNALLMPVTYKGIGRDSLFSLTCSVVFKNALFKTDIKVAPYALDVPDPEIGGVEHFTIGQLKLTNEKLLLEELHIPIDDAPGEFG